MQQMKKLLILYKQLVQMGKATWELLTFLHENKIMVEITPFSCVLKSSNNEVAPNRYHENSYASKKKVCNNMVIEKNLYCSD